MTAVVDAAPELRQPHKGRPVRPATVGRRTRGGRSATVLAGECVPARPSLGRKGACCRVSGRCGTAPLAEGAGWPGELRWRWERVGYVVEATSSPGEGFTSVAPYEELSRGQRLAAGGEVAARGGRGELAGGRRVRDVVNG